MLWVMWVCNSLREHRQSLLHNQVQCTHAHLGVWGNAVLYSVHETCALAWQRVTSSLEGNSALNT